LAQPSTPPQPDEPAASPDQPESPPGDQETAGRQLDPALAGPEEPATLPAGGPPAMPPPGAAAPPPPAPGAPAGPPPPVTEPPPRPRRLGLKIGLAVAAGVVLLVVAGVVGAVLLLSEDVPEVGACMTDAEDPAEIEVVDCGSEQAAWQVVGHDGSRSEAEFEQATREEICQAFPDWENALWLRTNLISGEGEVVCLASAGAAAPAE